MMLLRAIGNGFRRSEKTALFRRCFIATSLRQYDNSGIRSIDVISSRRFASSENGKAPAEKKEARSQGGPISWVGFAVFAVIAAAGIAFVTTKKKEKDEQIAASMEKYKGSIGKPLLGGPWELVNFDNKLVSWRDYLGKWVIIYFGFTHCPDICPEELEKLCNVIESLKKDPTMPKIYPLFFTVDPYRDTPENIKPYCREYSPDLVGFSGSVDQVRKVCRMFRVYFSEGPRIDSDYIVDHSIIMYLMSPDGEYCEHYSRETPQKRMEIKVRKQIQAYDQAKKS